MSDKVRFLNVDVDNITMSELIERREGVFLTLHVDMLAKFQEDPDFYDLLDEFDIITCDSQILYFIARMRGETIEERVSGSDYFPLFYERWKDDPSVTIFLCGAMDDISERAQARINEKVGREMVVGAYGPPKGYADDPDEMERIIKLINESRASVLVVGLGAGPQEQFIFKYRDQLPHAKLFLPLGGTIDYEAGAVKRPPRWVTVAGLEWFWRLAREPRRRWRRYVIHQPPVLFKLALQAVGRYRDPFADRRTCG